MNKITTTLFTLCFLALQTKVLGLDLNLTLTSNSINRSFVLHSPGTTVGSNLPVMIVLHGDGGTGAGIKSYTGFDAIADANNFLVIYPDAINGSWNRGVDETNGDGCTGNTAAPDDIQFISDLIDYLCYTYYINKDKVYATGHSAGGFLTYSLALQLPYKIAAFSSVAGGLCGNNTVITNLLGANYTPVPMQHIHGDLDTIVAYPDADNTPTAWNEWPLSALSYPNCGSNTYIAEPVSGGTQRLVFCDGSAVNGKKVELIRIIGGGHDWPAVVGFNSASSIWNFSNQYQLLQNSACVNTNSIEDDSFENISLYPNPFSNFIQLNGIDGKTYQVTIYDPLGNYILQEEITNSSTIDLEYLTAGVYFLVLKDGVRSKLVKLVKKD